MRWIRFSIVLVVLTLLNAGNMLNTVSLSSYSLRPDLLLILLVFISINCERTDAIIASFVIGFAADISGSAIGPFTVAFGVIGSMFSQLRKVVIMKRMIHQGLAIFVTGLITGALAYLLTFFKTGDTGSNVFVVLVGSCFYSALVGPVVWLGLSAVSGWLGVRKHRSGRYPGR
ncbi:MAG: rod shape-determining protein MreD [Planctomycetota bacterium]|jgi:rod shape-determining protein MreD